jgi:hypothetical protein
MFIRLFASQLQFISEKKIQIGLQKISMGKHQLRDDVLYKIIEHLLENNKLKVLDLSANETLFKG